MNHSERQPINSQELRGRIEEQLFLRQYLEQNFDEIGITVEERLEKIGDSELIKEVDDYVVALDRLSTNIESIQWITALRRSGVSDEDIVRIWDIKLEISEVAAGNETL